MTVPHQMSAAYEALVDALRETAESANNGRVLSPKPIGGSFVATDKRHQARLNSQLFCKQWRCRSAAKTADVVHILIEVQELIDLQEKLLVSSTVRVNYFCDYGEMARLLQGFHYDYQHPPQDGQHPLFHAQTDDRLIEPDGVMKQDFVYKVTDEKPICFPHARIPTSDMTLGSVLLALVADHFEPYFFSKFREQFLILQNRLPHPNCAVLRDNLKFPAQTEHLKSNHWYAKSA